MMLQESSVDKTSSINGFFLLTKYMWFSSEGWFYALAVNIELNIDRLLL